MEQPAAPGAKLRPQDSPLLHGPRTGRGGSGLSDPEMAGRSGHVFDGAGETTATCRRRGRQWRPGGGWMHRQFIPPSSLSTASTRHVPGRWLCLQILSLASCGVAGLDSGPFLGGTLRMSGSQVGKAAGQLLGPSCLSLKPAGPVALDHCHSAPTWRQPCLPGAECPRPPGTAGQAPLPGRWQDLFLPRRSKIILPALQRGPAWSAAAVCSL